MSLFGSFSSSKSKSTSTANQNETYDKAGTSVTTPNAPDFLAKGLEGLGGLFSGLAAGDLGQFVAGPTALQQQQFGLASSAGQSGLGWLNQAADMAGAQAGPAAHADAQTAYGGIGNYLNPAVDYIAGNTLNELGRARDMAQTGNGRDAVMAGQYGGSRQGVVDANLNRDFLGQAGTALGNIYGSSFNTALGASDADANRAQQTSIFNAGADNTLTALNAGLRQSGAGILAGLGGQGLGFLGDAAGDQYGIANAQAGAPLNSAQAIAAGYGSLPFNLLVGQTTNNNENGTSNTSGTSTTKGKTSGFSVGASFGG